MYIKLKYLACIFPILLLLTQSLTGQEIEKSYKKEYKKALKQIEENNFSFAIKELENLNEIYPNNVDILYFLAYCNYKLKDYNKAIGLFNQVSKLIDKRFEELWRISIKNNKQQKEYSKLKKLKKTTVAQLESCQTMKLESNRKYREKNEEELKKDFERLKIADDKALAENVKEIHTDNKIKGANVETPTIKSYESDSSSINISYEDYNKIPIGWIELISTNETEQINKIKEIVSNQFRLLQSKDGLSINKYETIIKRNHEYTAEYAFKQYEWFEFLKQKERDYRDVLDKYNETVNERTKIKNALDIAINDTIGIAQKIKIAIDDSLRIANIKNIALLAELRSKLSTIPQSVVLVGRISHKEGQNSKERADILMTKMTKMAIKLKNGRQILNSTLTENDELSELYEISTEGIAQTADKYFKSLKQALKEEIYTYEIYRIEVFPFNINSELESNTSMEHEQKTSSPVFNDIDIYLVSGNGNVFTPLLDVDFDYRFGQTSNAEEHGFNDSEKAFIDLISKTSDDFNKKYNAKVQEVISQYNSNKKYYNGLLFEYSNKIRPLRANLYESKRTVDSLKNLFNQLDLDREEILKNNYNYARQDYEDFYKQKPQFINQLEILSIENFDGTYEEGFRELAAKSYYSVIQNLSKRFNKTTIFKESCSSGENLSLSEIQIDYKPVITSFDVLTLGKYVSGDIVYLTLNLAFQIKWVLGDYQKIKEPVTAGGKNYYTKKEEISPVAHTDLNIENWRFFQNKPASMYGYITLSGKTNEKQPSYDELINLLNDPAKANDIINKGILLSTQYKFLKTIIISSDTFYNEDNILVYKGVEVNKTGIIKRKVGVKEGESALILLIKK